MRSDYALYAVAAIFFILTGLVLAYQSEMKELWTVTTFVLGLLSIGVGYLQRPRPESIGLQGTMPPSSTLPARSLKIFFRKMPNCLCGMIRP